MTATKAIWIVVLVMVHVLLIIQAKSVPKVDSIARKNVTSSILGHDDEDMVEEDMEELIGGGEDDEEPDEGNSSSGTGIEEDRPPDVPSSLRAKATASHIQVSWSPPKNHRTVIRGYTIGWGVGVPDVFSKVLEPRSRSFTITELEPQVEYVISLRAYNNMGDGQPVYDTVKTHARDTDSIQIFPPVGLKAIVLSSSSVVVKWTDSVTSAQTISDNRHYVIRYTSNFRSSNPKYKFVNATKTTHMIDDLRPSTQYEFAVKVLRGRQESTWSMSVINSTSEASPSSPPRDLTIVQSESDEPSSLRLQWQPPKYPNGQITGYVILYTTDPSLSDRDWSIHPLVGDKMNTILNSLLPDTTYYFKIQAKNEKGSGPVSTHVSYKTLPFIMSRSSSSSSSHPSATLTRAANENGGVVTPFSNPHSLYIIIAGISAVTLILLVVVSLLLCRSRKLNAYDRKRKGYSAAASSPRCSNKNKRSSRELNPPDLWIHHETLELKSLDKNQEPDLTPTPVLRTFQDPSSASPAPPSTTSGMMGGDDRKNISAYGLLPGVGNGGGNGNDSYYDDVSRGASSSITASSPSSLEPSTSQMHTYFHSTTSTIKRTGRVKPIMIPAESGSGMITSMGSVNFEPSTSLSRPVYPRTSHSHFYTMKPQLSCFEVNDCNQFDAVTGQMLPIPYPSAPTFSSSNVSYSSPTHSGSGGGSINSPTLIDQPPPPPSLKTRIAE